MSAVCARCQEKDLRFCLRFRNTIDICCMQESRWKEASTCWMGYRGTFVAICPFVNKMKMAQEEYKSMCLPWKILNADDLVLIVDNEQKLRRELFRWNQCLCSRLTTPKQRSCYVKSCITETSSTSENPMHSVTSFLGKNSILCINCYHWTYEICSTNPGIV